MLNLSISCTRFERNYSSCTGRSSENLWAAAEVLRKKKDRVKLVPFMDKIRTSFQCQENQTLAIATVLETFLPHNWIKSSGNCIYNSLAAYSESSTFRRSRIKSSYSSIAVCTPYVKILTSIVRCGLDWTNCSKYSVCSNTLLPLCGLSQWKFPC
jgi:hypothetical protein